MPKNRAARYEALLELTSGTRAHLALMLDELTPHQEFLMHTFIKAGADPDIALLDAKRVSAKKPRVATHTAPTRQAAVAMRSVAAATLA